MYLGCFCGISVACVLSINRNVTGLASHMSRVLVQIGIFMWAAVVTIAAGNCYIQVGRAQVRTLTSYLVVLPNVAGFTI